jgi:hypothetical protein
MALCADMGAHPASAKGMGPSCATPVVSWRFDAPLDDGPQREEGAYARWFASLSSMAATPEDFRFTRLCGGGIVDCLNGCGIGNSVGTGSPLDFRDSLLD